MLIILFNFNLTSLSDQNRTSRNSKHVKANGNIQYQI